MPLITVASRTRGGYEAGAAAGRRGAGCGDYIDGEVIDVVDSDIDGDVVDVVDIDPPALPPKRD
jgi:hypothetical protein